MTAWIFLVAQAWAEEGHGAAEAGAHGQHGVPWGPMVVQVFNFSVLLLVLFFLLRKAVRAHFENRAREYGQLVERAEAARRDAESTKREVESRLARLQEGAVNTVKKAEAEAGLLRERMLQEARQVALKLQQDAQRTAAVELEKAKAELRRELLQRALAGAKESMSKNLGSSEQKKLQNEFAEKIQVVGG